MAGPLDAPFRALFELSPDAILVFVGGVVAHANQASLALLRASHPDEVVGRRSVDLIHPESIPLVERHAAVLMTDSRSTATRSIEKYVRVDGTLVDVEVTAARATFLEGKAFIVFIRDITDRVLAQEREKRERAAAARAEAVAERERWLRGIIDVIPSIIFARDESGAFVLVNQACADFFGLTAERMLGRTLADLGHEHAESFTAEDREVFATGEPRVVSERVLLDQRGRRRVFEGVKLRAQLGSGQCLLGVLTDLTDRRHLEAQLVHSQKMEAIGRLAGGIAHDFNNLLTVIIESVDHLAARVDDSEGDLARVREASTRAASLTKQMLVFARQAPAEPRVLVVDDVVQRMSRLLVRVLGEDIAIETLLQAGSARASVDPGQIELVLMNLAVNARDAMPTGGTLSLSTRVDGRDIVVEVKDTGTGMDPETRDRAFEPFFTTKRPGEGTGLGLSTCYGIVQQLGGRLELESFVGVGTVVRMVLPRCEAEAARPKPPSTVPPPQGSGTVLLLEDDPLVRRATHRMLRSLGYQVLDAALPSEALALARDHAGVIDLLVTDVVMPQMNGVEAAHAFRALRPSAAVLFVSGYARDALAATGEAPAWHLAKPFDVGELAAKLREVLG
jgi:PAS domain S-box-containing protein